jgi:hypothetical protein
MTRIPGSYNSKCIKEKEGVTTEPPQVKIVQRWNGHSTVMNFETLNPVELAAR